MHNYLYRPYVSWLGGRRNSTNSTEFYWEDGTRFNYNKFLDINWQKGNCIAMGIDPLTLGWDWTTFHCTREIMEIVVCKKTSIKQG